MKKMMMKRRALSGWKEQVNIGRGFDLSSRGIKQAASDEIPASFVILAAGRELRVEVSQRLKSNAPCSVWIVESQVRFEDVSCLLIWTWASEQTCKKEKEEKFKLDLDDGPVNGCR